MDQERSTPTTDDAAPLTVCLLDPITAEVTIPGMGEVRVMRYWDDDAGCYGVRVVTDMATTDVPVQVGN